MPARESAVMEERHKTIFGFKENTGNQAVSGEMGQVQKKEEKKSPRTDIRAMQDSGINAVIQKTDVASESFKAAQRMTLSPMISRSGEGRCPDSGLDRGANSGVVFVSQPETLRLSGLNDAETVRGRDIVQCVSDSPGRETVREKRGVAKQPEHLPLVSVETGSNTSSVSTQHLILQRTNDSMGSNPGAATAPDSSVARPGETASQPVAQPAAPGGGSVDPVALADQVYTMIVERLSIERESMGL